MQPHEDINNHPQEEQRLPQSREELDQLLQGAKLEGVKLAAQTANHLLNTKLGGPLAFSDMAARSSSLPDNLRRMAQLSLQGVNAATATLQQLLQVRRIITLPDYPNILDLDKSTQSDKPSGITTSEHK